MATLDFYRRNVDRKRNEIAKLSEQKSKEFAKIIGLKNKIQSANKQIQSSKSLSTISSRQKELLRHQADIAKIEKKIAEFDSKITRKNKELNAEQKKLDNEQIKESKKGQQLQEKLQREQIRAMNAVNQTLSEHSDMITTLRDLPEEITVLFLASNPLDQTSLRLDEEARSVKEMIRKSRHRDAINLESGWAVRPGDILQYINECMPTIIHFSGHGSDDDELVLMDQAGNAKLVPLEAIVQAISTANENLRLVFFNTCFSNNQAEKVTEHVECAIGMSTTISDEAARMFSSQFYSSLTFGLSVETSFKQAKSALMLDGIPEENTPTLFVKSGCDAANMFIIAKTD